MAKRKASRGRGRGRPTEASNKAKDPPAKKPKLEPINFGPIDNDPIIDHLKTLRWDNKPNFDVGLAILDQIALDGLGGINFRRLLHVMDSISPSLNCVRDLDAQAYIWSTTIRLLSRSPGSCIRAYSTPDDSDRGSKSQQSDSSSSRNLPSSQEGKSPNKNLLVDKEFKLPKDTIARISKRACSLFAIQDGSIMGSCKSYLTRVDVTEDLKQISDKTEDVTAILHEINNKYDLDKIHFVADQEVRRKAILPDWIDPNIDIKMREYACLELIGKTRSLGVVFPNDKALGRYRILLTGKQLISQYQPKCTSHIVHHIMRFSECTTELPSDGKIYKASRTTNSQGASNDEVDDVDEFEGEDDGDSFPSVKSVCCNPRRLSIDRDMLKMVYHVIAFSRGRSPLDIRRKLRLPKFHVRNHLKNLANIELIGSHMKKMDDHPSLFRIYRARHKSSLFMGKLREKLYRLQAKSDGKMKFDDTDLRAKSILGVRRSQFSQAEDSLLIICRICCLLLEPKLTKKVSFCVNKRFIRDLMHDELCESHDKTADACLRRIKYLRKLPNNIMSIDELTAELRDDSDILRFTKQREAAKTDEKLNKLFMQILRVVRAKLPHLLGLGGGIGGSGHPIAQRQVIKIASHSELMRKYELIDCQATSTNRCNPHPGTTLLQLAQPLDQVYQLDLSECNEMAPFALLSSVCTANCFNVELGLKIPPLIVGLDQGNESFKQLRARAQTDSTKELLTNLSSADGFNEPDKLVSSPRRALFMLRNELKSQALADALIVKPCNVRFSSSNKISFEQHPMLAKLSSVKAIEMVLSWALVMPGIEFEKLVELTRMGEEELVDLIELMKELELICESRLELKRKRASSNVGGIVRLPARKATTLTYEPAASAYIKFVQLRTLMGSH